ncbi:MAG: hypothetical protein ACP5IZ_07405 [Thermoprotei archaeon]|jgi:hypothetical protein
MLSGFGHPLRSIRPHEPVSRETLVLQGGEVSRKLLPRILETLLILYAYSVKHNVSELIPFKNAIEEFYNIPIRSEYKYYLRAVRKLQKEKLIIINGKFSKNSPLRVSLTHDGIRTAETIIKTFSTIHKSSF